MKIYFTTKEDGTVTGWSSSQFSPNEIELELTDDHDFFKENAFKFRFDGTTMVKNTDLEIKLAKGKKLKELRGQCSATLIGRFPATIDGTVYYFSNDSDAQRNLKIFERALEKGKLQSVTLNAYTADGTKVRLTLDKTKLGIVFDAQVDFLIKNLYKLNDDLEVKVRNANDLDQLKNINWN